MAITRITQTMLTQRSLSSVQDSLLRLSNIQQQMSTGKKINVPSDDPTGTAIALHAQAGIASQTQYQRNAADGMGWLSTVDSALSSSATQVTRAYQLAIEGANNGAQGQTSQDAIADEIDQIRSSLIDSGNTAYLGRPVFGGTTAGASAFDSTTGDYVGDDGTVQRRVGDSTLVRVDTSGVAAFGDNSLPASDQNSSVFQHLAALSTALRSGDSATVSSSIGLLQGDLSRLSAASAAEGAAYDEVNTANNAASANQLALQKTQTNVEDIDLAAATIGLATQQTAYQAALAATAKTMQPSLLDFLQ